MSRHQTSLETSSTTIAKHLATPVKLFWLSQSNFSWHFHNCESENVRENRTKLLSYDTGKVNWLVFVLLFILQELINWTFYFWFGYFCHTTYISSLTYVTLIYFSILGKKAFQFLSFFICKWCVSACACVHVSTIKREQNNANIIQKWHY